MQRLLPLGFSVALAGCTGAAGEIPSAAAAGGAPGAGGTIGGAGATSSGGAIDGGGDAIDAALQDSAPSACPGLLGHPSAPCDAYPKRAGYTLAMVEDFDQPIDLAADPLWTWSDGQSDQGLCRFTKDAIAFSSGMAIFTMDTAPANLAATPSFAEGKLTQYPAPMPAAYKLTSGELRTKYNSFRYGYYEVRIKTPQVAKGNFVTGMYAYRTPKWQQFREVVVELQALKNRTCPTDVCNGDNRPAWDASFAYSASPQVPFDTEDGFHVFSFEWLPSGVKWYADRDTYPDPIETYSGAGNAKIPEVSMKLMMNLWAFPTDAFGGGNPNDNVYPMTTSVDWIRFYKWDSETFYPCSPVPDCLPPEDRDYSKNNAEDGIPSSPSGT